MIFNIITAIISGFMTFHNANKIKEDYQTPYEDCKVIFAEDGSWASKVRWGANIGLDTAATAPWGLLFADSVSGGKIHTAVTRDLLEGFKSSDDLEKKCSQVIDELSGNTNLGNKNDRVDVSKNNKSFSIVETKNNDAKNVNFKKESQNINTTMSSSIDDSSFKQSESKMSKGVSVPKRHRREINEDVVSVPKRHSREMNKDVVGVPQQHSKELDKGVISVPLQYRRA